MQAPNMCQGSQEHLQHRREQPLLQQVRLEHSKRPCQAWLAGCQVHSTCTCTCSCQQHPYEKLLLALIDQADPVAAHVIDYTTAQRTTPRYKPVNKQHIVYVSSPRSQAGTHLLLQCLAV
jgi:hypothetical protein